MLPNLDFWGYLRIFAVSGPLWAMMRAAACGLFCCFFVIFMSKGNMLLGYARGKVGDLVFSRSNGQQIVRARATNVKNPQTETQMIQRIILNTVAQAYSRFKAICDHSFEGINGNQKSMSYFMRRNIDNLRSRVQAGIAEGRDLYSIFAFTPVNSADYSPNEYIISKGTLPEITPGFNLNNATMALSANTYAAVLADFGLQRGDQLTFITTQGLSGAATNFSYARVILDPTNPDGSQASLDSTFIVDEGINLPNERNEGAFNVLQYADTTVQYNFSNQSMTGAAIIVSRKNADGTWLRSNAILQLDESGLGWLSSLGECLDLLMSGSIDTLNSRRYLNNAGTGTLASTGNRTVSVEYGEGRVTIVSVGYETVHRTPEGQPTSVYQAVICKDSDGNWYGIKCNNLNAAAYGLLLTSMTEWNQQAFTLNFMDEMDDQSAYYKGGGNLGLQYAQGEFWDWLISNGVSEHIMMEALLPQP